MKILIIGSGGREHALAWKISQSKLVGEIFFAPGNGGTSKLGRNIDIDANQIDRLVDFSLKEEIDLTIVGPEEPLALGIVDRFKEKGLKIFGPEKSPSRLESSKEFSKGLMDKYGIATARYQSFTSYKKAKKDIENFSLPLVIKADGLCRGKGVFICNTYKEGREVLKDILEDRSFGEGGSRVIIEEFLVGKEVSLLCFVSGNKIIPMESALDYQKIGDRDQGLNTGGVGSISPNPILNKDLNRKIDRILEKISLALEREGLEYTGILFIGFMIDQEDINILEFNVRFGDPESQSVILRLESDLVDLILKTIDYSIEKKDLIWTDKLALSLVTTSQGYPEEFKTGYEITGLDRLDRSVEVFHNGTKIRKNKLESNGGRVVTISALGEDIKEARERIYREVEKIYYPGIYYRKDIGKLI